MSMKLIGSKALSGEFYSDNSLYFWIINFIFGTPTFNKIQPKFFLFSGDMVCAAYNSVLRENFYWFNFRAFSLFLRVSFMWSITLETAFIFLFCLFTRLFFINFNFLFLDDNLSTKKLCLSIIYWSKFLISDFLELTNYTSKSFSNFSISFSKFKSLILDFSKILKWAIEINKTKFFITNYYLNFKP